METTITEALAEIKLIDAKVAKKQSVVFDRNNLMYLEQVIRKPVVSITEEIQSIEALLDNREKIRAAIMASNVVTRVEIGGIEKTIYGWLCFKKETGAALSNTYQQINAAVSSLKEEIQRRPSFYKDDKTGENRLVKAVFTIDDKALLKKAEDTAALLEKIDGVLSLKNATTVIRY